MKHIELFESFVKQNESRTKAEELKDYVEEEHRIKNRIHKNNDKIKMGDYVYKDNKSYRCIESDGKGNTQIQEVIKSSEMGEIITLTDKQVINAEPLISIDHNGNDYSWIIK
jgi:hypothetical protein